MAFIIILIPIVVIIYLANNHRQRRSKKIIPENYALPIALFFIMCYVAYKLKIDFWGATVIFGFGYLIGLLHANASTENEKDGTI